MCSIVRDTVHRVRNLVLIEAYRIAAASLFLGLVVLATSVLGFASALDEQYSFGRIALEFG